MKHAWIAAAAFLFVGCSGESIHPPEYPQEPVGDEGTEVAFDPAFDESLRTAELGTDRTRGIAKTLEWTAIGESRGTEVGDSYLGDALAVDHIFRDDADNQYGVRVRLKNSTKNVVALEYLVRFYTRSGGQILGYAGVGGAQERWKRAVADPFGTVVVGDFARVRGAEGFRLFVRKAGGKEEGIPDDPAQREERRRAREAAAGQK